MNFPKNHRYLAALAQEPVDRVPVWLMRQAGRYLPEYQKLRQHAGGIMPLFRTPELACTATLQPLQRYPLDAAILFSDILTIPDAMGLGLYFSEGEGPRFRHPIRELRQINDLPLIAPEKELRYVMDAVALICRELAGRTPLIGFCGSPWTMACYMVEGGNLGNFRYIKTLLGDSPAAVHTLLDKLARVAADYLQQQVVAGAHAIQIFDSWGGVLHKSAYCEFSLRYTKQIIDRLRSSSITQNIPVTLFTRNGFAWLNEMAQCGCDALSLDWQVDIAAVRTQLDRQVALQGNFDPALLYTSVEYIRQRAAQILDGHDGIGYIFNLGHGVPPDVHPEKVGALITAIQELSAQQPSSR